MSAADERVLLIVDDEREIRELVATVARRTCEHVRVVMAENAVDAEGIVREHRVVGLLTDLRMPGRSGIQLLQAVRESSPGTRRALMTGFHEDVIDGVPLSDLALTGLLRKPFGAGDLRGLLRELSA